MLSRSPAHRTACALDAFVAQAADLNQRNRATFTTLFPKASSRWLSHDECTSRAIERTSQGDIEGGLRWLGGSTLDFTCPRSLCAPYYGPRGASCYDPASLVVLDVAAKVDDYVDDAHCCRDLHQRDQGRRYRQLASLQKAVPAEDSLGHVRARIGDDVIHQIMAVAVELPERFGLIKGELLRTDGPLESSYARYTQAALTPVRAVKPCPSTRRLSRRWASSEKAEPRGFRSPVHFPTSSIRWAS